MEIEVRDLTFSFDRTVILDSLSFTLSEGDVNAFLGVSGCGKSTLVKLIAGLLPPTSGSVAFGKGRNDKLDADDLAIIFQNSTLFPWKTVLANVQLALSNSTELDAMEILRTVGMHDSAHLYPHQLSGGMVQRVEFARVLAQSPKILLMDEPFSRLDVQYREKLQSLFLSVHSIHRPTTVFVTHDVSEAITVSRHLKVLVGNPVTQMRQYETGSGSESELKREVESMLREDFELRELL